MVAFLNLRTVFAILAIIAAILALFTRSFFYSAGAPTAFATSASSNNYYLADLGDQINLGRAVVVSVNLFTFFCGVLALYTKTSSSVFFF